MNCKKIEFKKVECEEYFEPMINTVGFIGDKYYVNGIYFGDVVGMFDGEIRIKPNTGNRYVDREIITLKIDI